MLVRRWYHGWTVVFVAVIFQAVSTGCVWYGFTLFVHPWMEEFGSGSGEVLRAISLMVLVMGLSSPAAGKALTLLSARVLVTVGAILLAIGFVGIGRATALWQITLIYATLLPVGATLTGPLIGQTLAVMWFTKRRGLAIGIAAAGTPVGALLVPHLLEFLFTHFGWRTANIMIAGFVVLSIVPLSLLVLRRMLPADVNKYPAEARSASEIQTGREWKVVQILSEPTFWLLGVPMVSINILLMAFQTNLGPRVEELGVGTLNTPFLISAYALALMTCNVLFGKLTDSIDGRYIFWLSATAMASNVVLMMGHPSLGRLFLACVIMGICEGALLPVVGVVLNRHFGTRSFGLVESLMLAMLIGIGMLGPVTMGMMRDLTGSYQLSLVVALALVAVASVIIKWLPNSGASPRLVSTGH